MSLMSSVCWITILVLTNSKSASKWIERTQSYPVHITGTLWCRMLTTMNPITRYWIANSGIFSCAQPPHTTGEICCWKLEAWEMLFAWHVSQDVCPHPTWWRLDLWQFCHGANGGWWHCWSMSVVGFTTFFGEAVKFPACHVGWNLLRIRDFNLNFCHPT